MVLGVLADTVRACSGCVVMIAGDADVSQVGRWDGSDSADLTSIRGAELVVHDAFDMTPIAAQGLRAYCEALSAYSRPSMRELNLSCVTDTAAFDFEDVRAVLGACPRLDTLTLERTMIGDTGAGSETGGCGEDLAEPACSLQDFTTLATRISGRSRALLSSLLGSVKRVDVRHCETRWQAEVIAGAAASDALQVIIVGGGIPGPLSDEERAAQLDALRAMAGPGFEWIDPGWAAGSSVGYRRDASRLDWASVPVVFRSDNIFIHLSDRGKASSLRYWSVMLDADPDEALQRLCAARGVEFRIVKCVHTEQASR